MKIAVLFASIGNGNFFKVFLMIKNWIFWLSKKILGSKINYLKYLSSFNPRGKNCQLVLQIKFAVNGWAKLKARSKASRQNISNFDF